MTGDYGKAITIQQAIQHIVQRRYLLPAIQRKFTWSTTQICVLFDSIMRGYPINTFMFWNVSDPNVKKDFRFYQFLEKYCERFREDNDDFDTASHSNFDAVIDGQQRLTSLYIGLKGTYAYRLPRKWWPKVQDDTVLPPRKLYLNLAEPLDEESNEDMMKYEFDFLIPGEALNPNKIWFPVREILVFDPVDSPDQIEDVVLAYLDTIGQTSNSYALTTLCRLYYALRHESLIHFYNEPSQNIDHVLDIFIRTNHGGTPLSYSDLLMSIAIANWKKDARQQIDALVDDVRRSSDMEFSINRDLILKTALTLIDADVRFRVENFAGAQVARIEQEWEDIKACILATFRLIHSLGLNDASMRAKNAAIPIAYFLYNKGRDAAMSRKGIYTDINKLARHAADRQLISQWLHMSLLKGVFGGQSDTLLANLRKIIHANLAEEHFPLDKIVAAYRGLSKDLVFDDEFIQRLLKTQKDDASCYSILALLMPGMDYSRVLHKDHLHPAAAFDLKALDACDFLRTEPDQRAFFANAEYWDSIVNLQLLDDSLNMSKRDQPLAHWFASNSHLKRDQLLIPEDASLEFVDYPSFIRKRTDYLAAILKKLGRVTTNN